MEKGFWWLDRWVRRPGGFTWSAHIYGKNSVPPTNRRLHLLQSTRIINQKIFRLGNCLLHDMTQICPSCGKKHEAAKICPYCNAKVSDASIPPEIAIEKKTYKTITGQSIVIILSLILAIFTSSFTSIARNATSYIYAIIGSFILYFIILYAIYWVTVKLFLKSGE